MAIYIVLFLESVPIKLPALEHHSQTFIIELNESGLCTILGVVAGGKEATPAPLMAFDCNLFIGLTSSG